MPDHFLSTAPVSAVFGFGMLEVLSCLVLLASVHRPLTTDFYSPFLRLLVLLVFALTVRTSYKSSYAFSKSSQLFASSASRAQSITASHPAYTAPSWWSHVYSSCSKWWVQKLWICLEVNDLVPWILFIASLPHHLQLHLVLPESQSWGCHTALEVWHIPA